MSDLGPAVAVLDRLNDGLKRPVATPIVAACNDSLGQSAWVLLEAFQMDIPFDYAHQLYDMSQLGNSSLSDDQLPGQPRIRLGPLPEPLFQYLENDLCTRDLDLMSPKLWLMATRSGGNVSPLHHQRVKGRRVIITEDPRLHLLWIDDYILIKPLPMYLLSYDFWEKYLLPESSSITSLKQTSAPRVYPEWDNQKTDLAKAALGFLRTYLLLIQYQSDFDLALAYRLMPVNTTFESFCLFSSRLETIKDSEVSPRYHYGELRLARLNMWCKVLLGRWHYQTVHRQYAQYFARFYGPLLFLFGVLSVVLSALQVEMAVENQYQSAGLPGFAWPHFWKFSRVFSVLSLVAVGLPTLAILALLVGKPAMEMKYALTH